MKWKFSAKGKREKLKLNSKSKKVRRVKGNLSKEKAREVKIQRKKEA